MIHSPKKKRLYHAVPKTDGLEKEFPFNNWELLVYIRWKFHLLVFWVCTSNGFIHGELQHGRQNVFELMIQHVRGSLSSTERNREKMEASRDREKLKSMFFPTSWARQHSQVPRVVFLPGNPYSCVVFKGHFFQPHWRLGEVLLMVQISQTKTHLGWC